VYIEGRTSATVNCKIGFPTSWKHFSISENALSEKGTFNRTQEITFTLDPKLLPAHYYSYNYYYYLI
jgi:hypothetical protein